MKKKLSLVLSLGLIALSLQAMENKSAVDTTKAETTVPTVPTEPTPTPVAKVEAPTVEKATVEKPTVEKPAVDVAPSPAKQQTFREMVQQWVDWFTAQFSPAEKAKLKKELEQKKEAITAKVAEKKAETEKQ